VVYVVWLQRDSSWNSDNKIEGDGSQFNGTPAISDGQLFLRSAKALYGIGE
jgi:hypothetical protein